MVELTSRWGPALFLALAAAACTPRPIQTEIGTPSQRLSGRTLVLLPRTCVAHRSVPGYHFRLRDLAPSPTRTTDLLRSALDTLGEPDANVSGVVVEEGVREEEGRCEAPPELDFRPRLEDYRASPDTLRLMKDRGVDQAVVLEVHTVMACARPDGSPLLAYYDSVMQSDALPSLVPRDVCLEDEITLTAFLFRRDGTAAWALTRELHPSDPVEWAVDRVLDRVPVTMPARPRPFLF